MNEEAESRESTGVSRRDFLGRTAAATAGLAGSLSIRRAAHAAGDDTIKIAFIGCGGRGTGACAQALSTKGPVKLVAMADAFADRIETSLANLLKNENIRGKIDVPKDRQFVGYDAYHQANYLEGIQRVRDGAVGRIMYLRTYFNMPGAGFNDRGKPEGMSELEYQVRRGRGNGQIYDHHFVEYEFADGARHYAQARQIGGTWSHVSDNVHGTKKTMILGAGPYGMGGPADYRGGEGRAEKKKQANPYQQEHDDLAKSIRGGPHVFEGDYAATSSMTAVLGRMATYCGKVVTWDEGVASDLKLGPAPDELAANPEPPVHPGKDGRYPVAMPGITKAW